MVIKQGLGMSYIDLVLSAIFFRLVGDLIYLDVVTLEGNKFCITGTTKAFYVNSSTGNILDSRPAKSNHEASTLIGLLQKLSPKFKKGILKYEECQTIADISDIT